MKRISLLIISLLLFTACSDSIENTANDGDTTTDEGLNLAFSLKNAPEPILAVTGQLKSTGKPDKNFDFTIDGDMASYNLDHIETGTWDLTINAYANVNKSPASLRYNGMSQFQAIAGQRTTITITLNPTTGELDVTVSWGYNGKMDLLIDFAGQDETTSHYSYSLVHTSLPTIAGDLAVVANAEKINFSKSDIPQGNWSLTVEAKDQSNAILHTSTHAIVISPGTITKVIAQYNPAFNLDDNMVPDGAGKSYISDEALRQYLIIEKGFSDLREPYILNTDAESVKFLDLNYETNFYKYAEKVHSKGFSNQLNLDVITAFKNLKEIHIFGFYLNKLVIENHPSLLNVELYSVFSPYVDLSGAPNLVAFTASDASAYWVDISQNPSIQFLELTGGGLNKSESLFFEPDFTGVIGAVYINPSMASNPMFTQHPYQKFIDSSYDTDSLTVTIPDADAKRALLAYNFIILKSNKVLQSQTQQLQEFHYPYFNGGCKGCGKQKGSGTLYTYQPLYSVDVLKLFPNLMYLELFDQRFSSIDLSMNPMLLDLYLEDNEVLTSLDLSNNSMLGDGGYYKQGSRSKLEGMTGRERRELHKSLRKEGASNSFYLNNSPLLASITFGTHESLIDLVIGDTKLSSIDLTGLPNLQYAYIYENPNLSSVTFSTTDLYDLDLSYNNLSTLDLSNQTGLGYVYLDNNQLTSLDASALTNLYYFYINNNNLSSLDVSGLTNLYRLEASNNSLTSITLSGNNNLYRLYLDYNQLTSINLVGATYLNYLYINNNLLTGTLNISPMRSAYSSPASYVNTTGNPGLITIQYDDNCNNQSNVNVIKDVGTTFTQLGCKL